MFFYLSCHYFQLDDLGDEVSFKDAALPEASLPSLEKFRITTPVKLCIVKLFGKKVGTVHTYMSHRMRKSAIQGMQPIKTQTGRDEV